MKKLISVALILAVIIISGVFVMTSSYQINYAEAMWTIESSDLQEAVISEELVDTEVKLTINKNMFSSATYDVYYDQIIKKFVVTVDGTPLTIEGDKIIEIASLPGLNHLYPLSEIPTMSYGDRNYDYTNLDWRYMIAYQKQVEKIATNPTRVAFNVYNFETPILEFSKQPKRVSWTVDGESIEPGDFVKLVNGKYDATIKAEYSEEGLEGTITYDVRLTVDRQPLLMTTTLSLTPGELGILHFSDINQMDEVTINGNKFPVHLSENNQGYAFVPISYNDPVGTFDVSFYDQSGVVEVINKDFPIQHLIIDESIEAATRTDDAYYEYNTAMNAVRANSAEEKLWDGIFVMPCEGPISTEFGERRYVNDVLTSYRHSGIDIAVWYGTPVVAPNDGVVVYSDFLTLTGNTVVIDHGLGIQTIFYHLEERFVEAGQKVVKGEEVATVGSTGFSTGPHLHWTMGYYGLNVEPWMFMDPERFTIDE